MNELKEKIRLFLLNIQPENPTHRAAVARMVVAMFERQTADEQSSETTKHTNGVGFNGTDANFLSNVAKSAMAWQAKQGSLSLSPKQTAAVAKCLVKYSGQLAAIKMQGE